MTSCSRATYLHSTGTRFSMVSVQNDSLITPVRCNSRQCHPQIAAEDPTLSPEKTQDRAIMVAKATSAEHIASHTPSQPLSLLTKAIFGYVVMWLSEFGRLESPLLLQYTDVALKPTWRKGGLYYQT